MNGRRRIAALLVGLAALAGCSSATVAEGTVAPSAVGAATTEPAPPGRAELAPAAPHSSLPTMSVAQLPPEGVATLELIHDGGPFPYDQDGATFQNREGLLPAEPSGFYREFTVITPGSDDRGARRVVAGDDGCRFYTSDHYASFREVVSR